MFKDFETITPRGILIASGLHIEKPTPNKELLKYEINKLPIVDRNLMSVIGTGDYDNSNSSDGTVVISKQDLNYVVKFPLGALRSKGTITKLSVKDAINTAKEMKRRADIHGKRVPTEFFVAQIGDEVKVITFQRKSDKPICDMPLSLLLNNDFINQSDEVMKLMSCLKTKHGFNDFIGLHIATPSNLIQKITSYLIYNTPWFSDNIMVNRDNQIEITDNTPRGSSIGNKGYRKILRNIKSMVIWKSIIFLTKSYSTLSHLVSTERQNNTVIKINN